jgi:hypothetical protein
MRPTAGALAAAARRLAVSKFAADIVGRQTVELYRSLLDAGSNSEARFS